MTEQTMAAGFAASFADYACDQGAKRDILLADSGLTEDRTDHNSDLRSGRRGSLVVIVSG